MATVSLVGLRKAYQQSVAVHDVSLDIADGEFVALLGPSGCGKTTTLRMVAGFVEPSGGEVKVGNRVLSTAHRVVPPEDRGMSMIFQTYAVWPHMTVLENVAFGLRLRKIGRAEVAKRVKAMLTVVRLDQVADRYPSQLSGGQQQRVALARALVVKPETLLLDEPLSNLDANLREEMRFEIRRLHNEFGITSIYVTHDQAEAMVTADRIVVMHSGRIQQVGTAEDIYERPETRFVASFIGMNNIIDCTIDGGCARFVDNHIATGHAHAQITGPAALSIRPHDVEIYAADLKPASDENLIAGEIRRAAFLGKSRDYLVGLPQSGIEIRVATRPSQVFRHGEPVWLHLPPERCRLLGA